MAEPATDGPGEWDEKGRAASWVDWFLTHLALERGAAPKTIDTYRRDLRAFVEFGRATHAPAIGSISRLFVQRWLTSLERSGTAPRSVGRRAIVLRRFYAFLVAEGLVTENPTLGLLPPDPPPAASVVLTVAEVEQLLAAPDPATALGCRDRAILELLYGVGLKAGELTALNLPQLDLDREELVVWQARARSRTVPLGAAARAALAEYVARARAELVGNRVTNALFVNRFGERLTRRSLDLIVERHREAAGLPVSVTPHALRATCAAHLLAGGAEPRAVQALLGHASVHLTCAYGPRRRRQPTRSPS
ncbi:MAG: tyrosine-type recombinase/integrase [Chloroflexi bacterium]|nr:tyrosine-type recombinase/integrase [Chloroflexota bacterium]